MSLAFGKPDPNILRSSGTDFNSFSKFTFKTIGKEPELLKRISNREEGVRYQYSPSPEPESPPPPARNETEARTRPSLLQALTSTGQASQGFSMTSDPVPPEHTFPAESPSIKSSGMDSESMQLQYPETPEEPQAATFNPPLLSSPPPTPPPPPFIPDYSALKELHTRLETSHKVIATPPPPKKAETPPPEFPRPSLIAANNAVHHTEKMHTSAKDALQASQVRVSVSEKSVSAAQLVVDTLEQALLAARATLEGAQRSLLEARQAAEEAQAALTASRAAADAAEETKRLLEEPPPPRAPSSEPVKPNEQVIGEMKKDLDTLRLWVEEQEVAHRLSTGGKDSSQEQDEEEEREAGNLVIVPDDDTDSEARDKTTGVPTSEQPEMNSEGNIEVNDLLRVSEEDAARALMELAEQKPEERRMEPTTDNIEERSKAEALTASAMAERRAAEENEFSLAREAALRKLQETKREQVRVQKEQAQAAAAISILKERQDAAAAVKGKTSAASTTPPSQTQHLSGNGVARAVVLPPAEPKDKSKKTRAVLSPEITVKTTVKTEPSMSGEFSPALERAAALGLRVRPVKSTDSHFAPNSKPTPRKRMRNHSLPPISYYGHESSSPDEISAHRIGSDVGNIPIIPPAKAPMLPLDLSTDVQLMNLRFALQDEGIPWEAISRSRPALSLVKTEEAEAHLHMVENPPVQNPSSAQSTSIPHRAKSPTETQTSSTPTIAPSPLKPLPSRKQLPKFNKHKGQSSKPVVAAPTAQSRAMPQDTAVRSGPSGATSATISRPPVIKPLPPSGALNTASTRNAASAVYDGTPTQGSATPSAPAEAPYRPSNQGYRPVDARRERSPPAMTAGPGANYNPDGWRGRSPPRYGGNSPRARSRTPERYGGRASTSYIGGEPGYGKRTPEFHGVRYPGPSVFERSRPPSPPRAHTPPRPVTPPPRRVDLPAKRNFTGDHYSPGPAPRRPSAPKSYAPQHDSPPPPRGPRTLPRAPSYSQKRPREEDYTPPIHAQKRFKGDGRDAGRPPSRPASPPRWASKEAETERPALELRLGAPNSHYRGESYHPQQVLDQDEHDWDPKPEGLLSRLSDPARGRGRGGARGRANARARGGRGRGERSLADRMMDC
ncbi:hypothetical protein C8R43DRAFT_972109 [Mycena crocata]|nr:hypothetical protein C8R43DRAFT_972109 [Mycena crocata]